jgi:hypothetical protein
VNPQPLHAPVKRRLLDLFTWDDDTPLVHDITPEAWGAIKRLALRHNFRLSALNSGNNIAPRDCAQFAKSLRSALRDLYGITISDSLADVMHDVIAVAQTEKGLTLKERVAHVPDVTKGKAESKTPKPVPTKASPAPLRTHGGQTVWDIYSGSQLAMRGLPIGFRSRALAVARRAGGVLRDESALTLAPREASALGRALYTALQDELLVPPDTDFRRHLTQFAGACNRGETVRFVERNTDAAPPGTGEPLNDDPPPGKVQTPISHHL